MKAATFANSNSVVERRLWLMLSTSDWNCCRVMPIAFACRPRTTLKAAVSGIPVDRRQMARMPCGPSSADRHLEMASIAAHAGAIPPTNGVPKRAGSGVCIRITPEPFATMRRAARSEEHTSELQSLRHLVCRLLLEKKKKRKKKYTKTTQNQREHKE